ncbi:hypothetical protein Prum_001880 [Phytohabitans rumicis]|uniref:Uncharacterized protein n=2 Tax=Phytohabitans rumicis TaxID=1076125 RepID=A0A6V8KXI7_9ACTN|nr:hypothetical protein Prum_001880 [Phytohabitans rumicis]
MRPSDETVPAANGSATAVTCSTAVIRATAASTADRWSASRWPSGAAKTARALPPAASGNRSSSSSIARSLWLPGAMKSSANEPPAVPASAMMIMAVTVQAAIVIQGLRALAAPMRRVKEFMAVIVGAATGRRLPAPDGPALPRRAGWRTRRLRPAAEAGPTVRADDGAACPGLP